MHGIVLNIILRIPICMLKAFPYITSHLYCLSRITDKPKVQIPFKQFPVGQKYVGIPFILAYGIDTPYVIEFSRTFGKSHTLVSRAYQYLSPIFGVLFHRDYRKFPIHIIIVIDQRRYEYHRRKFMSYPYGCKFCIYTSGVVLPLNLHSLNVVFRSSVGCFVYLFWIAVTFTSHKIHLPYMQ